MFCKAIISISNFIRLPELFTFTSTMGSNTTFIRFSREDLSNFHEPGFSIVQNGEKEDRRGETKSTGWVLRDWFHKQMPTIECWHVARWIALFESQITRRLPSTSSCGPPPSAARPPFPTALFLQTARPSFSCSTSLSRRLSTSARRREPKAREKEKGPFELAAPAICHMPTFAASPFSSGEETASTTVESAAKLTDLSIGRDLDDRWRSGINQVHGILTIRTLQELDIHCKYSNNYFRRLIRF